MFKFWRLVLLFILSSFSCVLPTKANETMCGGADSVRVINEVTVQSKIRYHETIEPQQLNKEALTMLNAHSVADAMRFLSGVQLKDYGGVGGLKTVNIRSMGSQHVGVYYDGIELGNAQNGVIDLGQFSLDNIEEISIYQGQRSAILQTASDFANAGSIHIRTRNPLKYGAPQKRIIGKFQFASGNLLRLSSLYEQPLGRHTTLSTNIEGISGNGKYKFRYRRKNYDGSLAYDTTAFRQNGDILAFRAEANLYGRIVNGHWETKVYTYHSRRGIPGAIVNNVWKRGERQHDDNTFIQGSWLRDISERQTLRVTGKYAYYHTHYQNNDSSQLTSNQHYWQQEAYWNITHVTELLPWWSISISYDGRLNRLRSDAAQFADPTRQTQMGAVATAMDLKHVQLQGSLVYTSVSDHVKRGTASEKKGEFTPALFCSWKVNQNITLTTFAKQSFRLPTFNDLYYTQIGNALLKPEYATQYDLGINGITTVDRSAEMIATISGSIHLYHNDVKDKIVAYPQGQQFRWTMLNLGRVYINGIDVNLKAQNTIFKRLTLTTMLQYTYQQACDVTDKNSSYYRDQIPYTPWHSGSASILLTWCEWEAAYNLVYTGERYCQPENIDYNHLQPWYTSDLHLGWQYKTNNKNFKITLEVNNLLNQQYDVIINYPMPGRNYNLTMQCEL